MAEYRDLRAKYDFLTLCKTPELACEVTLQPIEHLGVDAAILFADILLVPEAMGSELRFVKGDGPVFPDPVRRAEDVDRLVIADVDETLGYVFDALKLIRRELDGRAPLIGFAGTPWTLASYLIEGGTSKSFAHLLGWSWSDPDGMRRLLDKIAEVTAAYVVGQVRAGAQAIQLFDTWGGLLDRRRWREIARPAVEKILAALDAQCPGVPRIFYIRDAAHLYDELADLPVEVLSVDWRTPLDEVRRRVGPEKVLQGNLDPTALLGSRETILSETARLLETGKRAGGGHIVNLGHGILPMTSVENARLFIETVQSEPVQSS